MARGDYSRSMPSYSAKMMTELAKDVAAIDVTDLLIRYSFDLNGAVVDRVVDSWLQRYPIQWVRLAVIEALYQGRYKAISVEQILNLWQRRGKSLYRFNHEFERIVCGRFPNSRIQSQSRPISPISSAKPRVRTMESSAYNPVRRDSLHSSPPNPTSASANPGTPVENTPVIPAQPTSTQQTNSAQQNLDPNLLPFDRTRPDLDETAASFSRGLPVQTFQPNGDDIDALSEIRRLRPAASQQPIHQFIPPPASSDFYSKLKAVAQETTLVGADSSQPTATLDPEANTRE